MANELVYGLNGLVIALAVLAALLLAWFLFASYRAHGLTGSVTWWMVNTKNNFRMITDRMRVQRGKAKQLLAMNTDFVWIVEILTVLFFIFFFSIALSLYFQLDFLGLQSLL